MIEKKEKAVGAAEKAAPTKPQKAKDQFKLIKSDGTHTVLPGVGHVKFGGGDWVSPGRQLYRDVSASQKDLEAVYNIGPEMKDRVKSPAGYKATWEKLG